LDSILGQYGRHGPISDAAPAPNTPTKLSKYLAYAKKDLNIFAATTYEDAFRNNGIGPDILHLILDDKLISLGVNLGDTLQLKQHSLLWLNTQGNRKRKDHEHTPGPDDNNGHIPAALAWGPNTIRFEKVWRDRDTGQVTGRAAYYGEIADGSLSERLDYMWLYKDDLAGEMVPLPPSKVLIVDGVDTGVDE
jgi:hypothetical protein